jgi:aspartyl-tRNA(Asn)/glutamyl-tRNA(Gln) amidotransferase subunit B
MPTINRKAVECAVMTALALNCSIASSTKFDRKNYSYPDLMKGYQISQYDAPIGEGGWLDLDLDGVERRIGITRVHLEEDVAKLTHRTDLEGESYSLVDVNRAGMPLMEIVSDPDMRSPEEARQYLMKLRTILRYLGVSVANMEEGSFRCDANISIRPEGSQEGFAKIEVKNMNSFRAVYRALEYEESRQREVAAAGGKLVQETRGWIEEEGVTVSQRSKEYAHDYRYFPEPDLPPVVLSASLVEEIKVGLPELPDAKEERFRREFGLPLYDVNLLCGAKALADYFESCLEVGWDAPLEKRAKTVSNWLLGDVAKLLNARGVEIDAFSISPADLVALLQMVDQAKINGPTAKLVLEEMLETGRGAEDIVAEKGLAQISDSSALDAAVQEVIAAHAKAAEDFRSGKEQSLKFLVGQVMRITKGRADPKLVTRMLIAALEKEE